MRYLAKTKILPYLKAKPHKLVDINQLEDTIENMIVKITSQELTHPTKGKVDALNFPSEQAIFFYGPSWEKKSRALIDTRAVLFHEILGLMKVEDDKFQVSGEVFPLNGLAPTFSLRRLGCFFDVATISLKDDYSDQPDPFFEFYIFGTGMVSVFFEQTQNPNVKFRSVVFPLRISQVEGFHFPYMGIVSATLEEAGLFEKSAADLSLSLKILYIDENGKRSIVGSGRIKYEDDGPRNLIVSNTQYSTHLLNQGIVIHEGTSSWPSVEKKLRLTRISDNIGVRRKSHIATLKSPYSKEDKQKIHDFFSEMPNTFPIEVSMYCYLYY